MLHETDIPASIQVSDFPPFLSSLIQFDALNGLSKTGFMSDEIPLFPQPLINLFTLYTNRGYLYLICGKKKPSQDTKVL